MNLGMKMSRWGAASLMDGVGFCKLVLNGFGWKEVVFVVIHFIGRLLIEAKTLI